MKSSLRLSLYVLVLLTLVVLVFSIYTPQTEAGGGTLTKDDYLRWVGREVDLTWACTYYDSNYAATVDVNILSSSEKSMGWYNKHYVVGDGYWEALTEYIAYEPVYVIEEVCHIEKVYDSVTNETTGTEEVCHDVRVQSGTKEVTRQRWDPYSWDRNAKHLRFCAKLKPVLGFRSIEHIPVMFGYEFYEYDWWNSSWDKRKPININVFDGSTLSDYQLLLNITHDSDMNSDFSDLRFTNNCSSDATELDYWFEYNESSGYVEAWVKVDIINTTICMYYDNSDAKYEGNGYATFITFDDASSDKTGDYSTSGTGTFAWVSTGGYHGGYYTVSRTDNPENILRVYHEAATYAENLTAFIRLNNYDLNYYPWWGFEDKASPADHYIRFVYYATYGTCGPKVTHVVFDEDESVHLYFTGYTTLENVWLRANLTWLPSIKVIAWDITKGYTNSSTTKVPDTSPAVYFNFNVYPSQGCGVGEMHVDYWGVAKAHDPQPTYSIGSRETEGDADEPGGRDAIEEGIKDVDALGPDADIYPDQQLYLRYANTSQLNGTFDMIAIEDNQTWAFNYIAPDDNVNEETGMTNMTNVVYIWESKGLPAANITAQVKNLINSTDV